MRLKLRISGSVQGVGYRFFAQGLARRQDLTGWVRNCSNGDVETEAQGQKEHLENFILQLEKGHPWAQVSKIIREPLPEKNSEKGFEIRF
ncbi:MAG: acylphosphatase [Elusimicrobia bacterium]|nr:acylphosphatase [Elusimicrobiota bacterium]